MSSSASVLKLFFVWSSLTIIAGLFFVFFFPMISQTPGVACQTWASCVIVLVWMFFFWPLVDCVVLFVFFLWGKHVALFDPIDPGSRCPTLCNQALVHCDGPMPHTDLEDEKYDEFKGHWTDLFFYIILWWCFQGLTQGEYNTEVFLWLYLFNSFYFKLVRWQHWNLGLIQPDLCMILPDHSPMGFSGHFVALFRQPEQRLLSAWNDDEDVFRAEPTIPRCAPNRTAERYLTMEEFTEKSLVFFLSVYSPTSPFACVTQNIELMSTVPRVLTVKLNPKCERYSWSSWNTSPRLSMWPLVKRQTNVDIRCLIMKKWSSSWGLETSGSCPFT